MGSPIHEYVNTQGDAIKGKSVDTGKGATAALQPWQDAVVNYAKQQGLTVQGNSRRGGPPRRAPSDQLSHDMT